jgi:hypothetical protein
MIAKILVAVVLRLTLCVNETAALSVPRCRLVKRVGTPSQDKLETNEGTSRIESVVLNAKSLLPDIAVTREQRNILVQS